MVKLHYSIIGRLTLTLTFRVRVKAKVRVKVRIRFSVNVRVRAKVWVDFRVRVRVKQGFMGRSVTHQAPLHHHVTKIVQIWLSVPK